LGNSHIKIVGFEWSVKIIVIAIPTQVMRKVLSKVDLSEKFIINFSKGIEIQTEKFIHQICLEMFGDQTTYCSLSRPTHA